MFGRSDIQPQYHKGLGYEDDMRYSILIALSHLVVAYLVSQCPYYQGHCVHCTLCPPRFKSTLQQIHPIPLGAEITIDAYIDSPKSPEYLPARLTWNV